MSRPVSLAAFAGAAILVVIVYVTALGGAFGNSDEVIYAELIRAMQRTGDYLTLRYQGAILLQRPALPVTLYAAAAGLDPGEAGMRLAPALLSALSALAAGAIVWRRGREPLAAAAAALLCAGIPTYHLYGRVVFSDPPFVLACVGALAATMAAQRDPRFFVWIGAALGAAFAMKSLATAPIALGLVPWIIVAFRRHPARQLRPLRAALAFLALAGPYYVAGLVMYGERFLREHIGYNLLARSRGLAGIGLGGSPLAYLEHIWRADGPLLAVGLAAAVVGAAVVAIQRRDHALGVAATSAAAALLALSLLGTRLPHYLLPLYPSVAVCAGLLVARSRAAAGAAALAAVALLYVTSGRPSFDANLRPVPAAVTLGQLASAATLPEAPVYSLDWYAPALGYYADRPWHFLATMETEVRIVGSIDLFRAAGNVHRAPPWPAGTFVVAGEPDRLRAAGLVRRRLLGADGGRELWEAAAP